MTEPRTVRWGVMGTGSIASDFTQVLVQLPCTVVAAVGSRSDESAHRFGDRFGIATRHGSYEALAADASLDIIYVATPSLRHVDDCLLCLRQGRHVLCEKSMAPSADEAQRVLAEAQARGKFFLHGVWSRFFPAMAKLREVIDSGEIGTVVSAHASFAQADGAGACSAVLETGIYCAQFVQWAFGGRAPEEVAGIVHERHAPSGLDVHVGAVLHFASADGGSGVGTFECSLRHPSPRDAVICGTLGVIRVEFPFWCPTAFTVQKMSGQGSQQFGALERHEFPLPDIQPSEPFHFVNSAGLAYEAEEANRCVRAGLTETPLFSSAECLSVMRIISDIKARFQPPRPVRAALGLTVLAGAAALAAVVMKQRGAWK